MGERGTMVWSGVAALAMQAGCASVMAEENFYGYMWETKIADLFLKSGLTGAGVNVGQIEPYLPLRDHKSLEGQLLNVRSGLTKVDAHATGVASLIIGKRPHPILEFRGVAPGAKLYAAWMGPDSLKPPNNQAFYDAFKGALDWQLKDTSPTIVNMSWGADSSSPQAFKDTTDRMADWAVTKKNQLYVVGAGNDGELNGSGGDKTGNLVAPASAYNTLTVGNVDSNNKVFKTSSVQQVGKRLKPDLVAPGVAIIAANIYKDNKEAMIGWTGTSFATPLVTGTAALLQQHGAKKNFEAGVRTDSRVMRAVLMNSTNKTAMNRAGMRWDEEFADGASGKANMSNETGTGSLDAMQAYEQYGAGRKAPTFGKDETGKTVGEMGWDLRSVEGKGLDKSNDYKTSLLRKGTVMESTVCWNAGVITTDSEGKELGTASWTYDKIAKVSLAVSAEGTKSTILSTSDAPDASTQHNVYRIGERQRYYVRIYRAEDSPLAATTYAVAWRNFEMETKKVQSFNGGFDGDRGAYRDNGWYAAAGSVVMHQLVTTNWGARSSWSGLSGWIGPNNNAVALGNGTGALSGIAQEMVRPLAYFTVDFDLAVSSFDGASVMKIMLGDIDLLGVLGASLRASSVGGVQVFSHFSFTLNGSQLASLSGDFTEISFLAAGGNATFYLDNVEYIPAPGPSLFLGIGLLTTCRRRR